ncbi:hypothetical protein FOZ62_004899, partial [Perkinsus olseni]
NPKRKNSIISPLYNPPVKKEMNKFAALQAKDDLEAKQMAKLAAKKLAMDLCADGRCCFLGLGLDSVNGSLGDWRFALMSAEPNDGDYQLTPDQLAAFKEAFEIFDKQKLGVINYTELPALLRSVGQNPTEADIETIVEEWDPAGNQHFDLDTFLRICESDSFKDPMKEEVLMEAFRAFDPDGRGVLKIEELRRILQVLGERLDGEAADVFIDFAVAKCDPDKTGEINYEVLTQELLERDPKGMPRWNVLRLFRAPHATTAVVADLSRPDSQCCISWLPSLPSGAELIYKGNGSVRFINATWRCSDTLLVEAVDSAVGFENSTISNCMVLAVVARQGNITLDEASLLNATATVYDDLVASDDTVFGGSLGGAGGALGLCDRGDRIRGIDFTVIPENLAGEGTAPQCRGGGRITLTSDDGHVTLEGGIEADGGRADAGAKCGA